MSTRVSPGPSFVAMPVKKLHTKAAAKSKRKTPGASHARLSPYLRGVIYGMHLTGATLPEIEQKVRKPDGSRLSNGGAWGCVKLCEANGGLKWDGDASAIASSGRPRETTKAMDKALLKLVFKHRGRAIVTVAFAQKHLPAWRAVSGSTVERRLGEAGLAYLRRRRKSLVPKQYKLPRKRWAWWVKGRPDAELQRFAYTDGTVFYLARTEAETEDLNRAALGTSVWRQANGSDALYEDCVGPSQYWKAQGTPVRVWGLLCNGELNITILPEGARMTRWWYKWVIEKRFPLWVKSSFGVQKRDVVLVQDHERCLWCDEPLAALDSIGMKLLANFPKCSQDINPIEEAWREVRSRLFDTQPVEREDRDAFIVRLRAAVAWINGNREDFLCRICNCQVEWADDVLAAKGNRTKH